MCRLRYDPATQAYAERRTKQGLSKPEIIRCLKRYVLREVYRTLVPPPRQRRSCSGRLTIHRSIQRNNARPAPPCPVSSHRSMVRTRKAARTHHHAEATSRCLVQRLGTVPRMPTRSSRQLAMLSGLVALVAVVIGIVFFATSHPLRGIALLIVAALVAGYALITARSVHTKSDEPDR